MNALTLASLATTDQKIIVTGSMGAGKSTVVQTISTIPPLQTDVPITDGTGRLDKTTTTVALDYGTFKLESGQRLLIYGTPGQRRFDFMCRILARGALGLLILVDAAGEDPVGDLEYYLRLFDETVQSAPAVICLTRTDLLDAPSSQPFRDVVQDRGLTIPVLRMDARSKQSIMMAVMALFMAIK